MSSQSNLPASRALVSYSGFHTDHTPVIQARSIDDVAEAFEHGRAKGRHVTVRASGFSLDDQAFGGDLAVSVSQLRDVLELDLDKGLLKVQPGVQWGDVVDILLPTGWMAPVMPSSPMITAGGTLSSNSVSRMSPVHGREGEWVLEFELLTPEGELLTCSREHNADLFHAAIGGFGWFGCFASITYKLQRLDDRVNVETVIEAVPTLDQMFDLLRDGSLNPGEWDSVTGPALLGKRYRTGMVFYSKYSNRPPGPRHIAHLPNNPLRVPMELMMRKSWFSRLAWQIGYLINQNGKVHCDPIKDYNFFFDAQRKARAVAKRFGFKAPLVQQGFVFEGEGGRHFLQEEILPRLDASGIYPLLTDVLYMPAEQFLMSPNYERQGFAVTMAFVDLAGGRYDRTVSLLEDLTDVCQQRDGRLWLTKNAYGRRDTLGDMFAHARGPMEALKAKHDPHGVIRSRFMEKVLCRNQSSASRAAG